MKIAEIAFVGYPVTDVERARNFYKGTLGLEETMAHEMAGGKWWVEYEVAGQAIAISNAWPPAAGGGGPCVALEVTDLDEALGELRAAGCKIEFEPMDSPVCRFFGVLDPDGNSIIIHKRR